VFIKGDCIGGVDDLAQLERSGVLGEWLKDHQYDLIVIGGGSGGLAAAKVGGLGMVCCTMHITSAGSSRIWQEGGVFGLCQADTYWHILGLRWHVR
jgi:thioredoxin reductase (NADPH)